MMNDERQPLEFTPLPGANAQERQQAAREQWRQEVERLCDEEERLRDEEERRRQQEDWARQERESRLAERLASIAQRDRDEYRTPTAAGSLFEFLRHHWATFQTHRSVASSKPKRR